jgi:hypothetical protein
MKKRAMKKWIPENTIYCYKTTGYVPQSEGKLPYLKVEYCPWYRSKVKYDAKYKEYYRESYCRYTGITDIILLNDCCKVCGLKED